MNYSTHNITDGNRLSSYKAAEGLELLSEAEWSRLKPDCHVLLEGAGLIQASCSVWLSSLPEYETQQPVAIGHFQCVNSEAGVELLNAACKYLSMHGTSLVIGPVDANTWNKYRLVTGTNGHAPFLLEPVNPDHYVSAWTSAGFDSLAEFESTVLPPTVEPDPRLEKVQTRMDEIGLSIRTLKLDDFDGELERLYEVSCISFRNNLLYTPISAEDFKNIYRPFKDEIRPELVWLAEHEGQCVGYLFSIPDYAQLARGEKLNTLIAKTLAILPERKYAGLGLLLTQHCHTQAARAGFESVIHALLAPSSQIKHFGKDTMQTMRTYTLYQKTL